jgi:hypothetical protein
VISEIKYVDMTFPLYIHFRHFLQRMHENYYHRHKHAGVFLEKWIGKISINDPNIGKESLT